MPFLFQSGVCIVLERLALALVASPALFALLSRFLGTTKSATVRLVSAACGGMDLYCVDEDSAFSVCGSSRADSPRHRVLHTGPFFGWVHFHDIRASEICASRFVFTVHAV